MLIYAKSNISSISVAKYFWFVGSTNILPSLSSPLNIYFEFIKRLSAELFNKSALSEYSPYITLTESSNTKSSVVSPADLVKATLNKTLYSPYKLPSLFSTILYSFSNNWLAV